MIQSNQHTVGARTSKTAQVLQHGGNCFNWSIVALDQTQSEPWRNGKGSTSTLCTYQDLSNNSVQKNAAGHPWNIRCSVAKVVQAGDFSSFPNVTRWFSVLEGAGVQLLIDGENHCQTSQTPPLCFDGASTVSCVPIDGDTLDFNWMLFDRTGTMEQICVGTNEHSVNVKNVNQGTWVALYTHHHSIELSVNEHPMVLPARHLMWTMSQSIQSVEIHLTRKSTNNTILWMESK